MFAVSDAQAWRPLDDPRASGVRPPSGGGGPDEAPGNPPRRERGHLRPRHQDRKGEFVK